MRSLTTALIFVLFSIFARSAFYMYKRLVVLGAFRGPYRSAHSFAVDDEIFTLPELIQCEDLEYLPELGKILTACQGDHSLRYSWFPGVGNLHGAEDVERVPDGGLYVIDVAVGGRALTTSIGFPRGLV